jgi:dihydropyrimidine dehydrogenase (NAD+) subunit PreT
MKNINEGKMTFSTRKSNKLDNITNMEAPYTMSQALREASRCILCYDAPCSKSCPADTDPGTFIRKFRLQNTKGAIRTIKENNILGGVCGVVCPTEKLCQEACSATEIDTPIEIGKLQRFLVEHGWETGFNPLTRNPRRKEKIAIIGSGPAGLSCAAELGKTGFQVTVFEARENAGGVLRYGVPEFRLNGEFLDREIVDITNLGVNIKCNTRITSGGVNNLLETGFDAIFIATGLWNAYKLNIPGSNLKNVFDAATFLETVRGKNRSLISKLVKGNNVAIIGGGSVAMDVANSSKVLGANKVYCLCLESLKEIPAAKADLEMARDNFVIIKPQSQVTKISGNNGCVNGISGTETEWIQPNLLIPSNAKAVPGTEFNLKVDVVVMAIGSGPDSGTIDLCTTIGYKNNYLIKTKKDGVSTADRNVYAGGDIVRGSALVVDAVADGKKAALKIIKQFS